MSAKHIVQMNALPGNFTILPYGLRKPITFANVVAIREWIGQERANWSNLCDTARNLPGVERRIIAPIESLTNLIEDVDGQLTGYVRKELEGLTEEDIGAISSVLRSLEQPPFLSSKSILGQHILGIGQNDSLTASVSLGVFQGIPLPDTFRQPRLDATTLLRSVALYSSSDPTFQAELAGRRKTLTKLTESWERELIQLSSHARAFLSHAENETNDAFDRHSAAGKALTELHTERSKVLSDLAEEHRQSLTELTEQRRKELDELFDERKEALTKLEATYREHLRLKAPADYWKEKAGRHRVNARRWLGAVGVLALVGITGAGALYWQLLTWLDGLKSASVATASLVLLALPALLYATLVRMAHRSYRDEVRHTDDAEQRTTLVQTYLALTHENSEAIQPGERLLALHALFRGSAQSDSPDDTPPVNALEALLQGLKPKTGS